MHEFSLMADLLRKIETVKKEVGAAKVIGIHVKLGALSHMSGEHFREHFNQVVSGTAMEGVQLYIETLADPNVPHAQDIMLERLEVVQ